MPRPEFHGDAYTSARRRSRRDLGDALDLFGAAVADAAKCWARSSARVYIASRSSRYKRVPAGHQPLGARAPAAERMNLLYRQRPAAAPTRRAGTPRPRPPLPPFPPLRASAPRRRLRGRRRLHRPLRRAAPRPRRAQGGAARGASRGLRRLGPQRRAGRHRASGWTRHGWRPMVGRDDARRCGTWPRRPRRYRAPSDRRPPASTRRGSRGIVHAIAAPRPAGRPRARQAERLARDYGYDRIERARPRRHLPR